MAEIDPPSFSLGLDLDPPSFSLGLDLDPSSFCSGPHIDPPSFSLGLDLDPPNIEIPCQAPNSHARSSHRLEDKDEEFNFSVLDSDLDDTSENPAPARLKRLRREAYAKPPLLSNNQSSHQFSDKIEDVIEDFSSEDDHARKDEHKATGHYSVCSSSKIPLRGNRISTRQLPSLSSCKTRKQESRTLASTSLEGMRDKRIFAEPDISPLRMFQLLSSDSDSDDSARIDTGKDANGNTFLKQRETSHGYGNSASERSEPSIILPQKEHPHGSFCLEEAFNVPTPALDDFCAEYYKTIKDKNAALPVPVLESSFNKGELPSQTIDNRKKKSHEADLGNALPPAHQYFFHQDFRIQRLVRSRLPHFFPLAALNDAGNNQPDMSSIDYMSQFSHGGIRASTEKRSRKGRKKSTETKFGEFSQASGGSVNPTHPESMPKDAGKRRVHADDQSAGRWYTADGKRVYVAKNGQELTGKGAYKQYRKESGRGFKKTKKKSAANRKK